jgi:hypothetical protein
MEDKAMNQPSRKSARAAFPWGLLGMIGLLVTIESFIVCHDLVFSHPWGVDWRQSRRAASRYAPYCQILCFGDSLTKYGVAPRILKDRLGRRVYNLATIAGPPTNSFFLLRQALESGARPEAVLVDFIPHLLSSSPRRTEQLLPEVMSLRDCLDLAWTLRDPGLFGSLALARLLPSVKDRFEIRAQILSALRGEATDRRGELLSHVRNWTVNRGAHIVPTGPRVPGDDLPLAPDLYPPTWRCDPATDSYVHRFLGLAARHGIPVFWLVPPFSPEVQARRAQQGLDDQFSRYLHSVQAGYPNVVVVDGRDAGYDRTVHADPIHLNSTGASAFSLQVAEVLAHHLAATGGPRWVDLPRHRDGPVDAAVEDVAQSRLAVQQGALRR